MLKASVQYNDLEGTVAADVSDHLHNSLNEYLESEGIDTDKYRAIGVKCYNGQSRSPFSFSIICISEEDGKRKLIDYRPKESNSRDLFFSLFKRFDVVLLDSNYDGIEYGEKDQIYR